MKNYISIPGGVGEWCQWGFWVNKLKLKANSLLALHCLHLKPGRASLAVPLTFHRLQSFDLSLLIKLRVFANCQASSSLQLSSFDSSSQSFGLSWLVKLWVLAIYQALIFHVKLQLFPTFLASISNPSPSFDMTSLTNNTPALQLGSNSVRETHIFFILVLVGRFT